MTSTAKPRRSRSPSPNKSAAAPSRPSHPATGVGSSSSSSPPSQPPAAPMPSTLTPRSPPPPLPPGVDAQHCPFSLSSASHNLLLTLLQQSNHQPHPWIKCHKCGKWRKLPATLSALSPTLPTLPLTLQSLSELASAFLPFPFTCSAVVWDIDRRVCGAIQDYQDLVYEWKQVPLRFVRAIPRMDFYVALAHFLRVKGVDIAEYPCIEGKALDLYALYNVVYWAGGDDVVTRRGQWGLVYDALKLPVGRGAGRGGSSGATAAEETRDLDYLAVLYRSYFFEWQARAKIDFAMLDAAGADDTSDDSDRKAAEAEARAGEGRGKRIKLEPGVKEEQEGGDDLTDDDGSGEGHDEFDERKEIGASTAEEGRHR